MNLDHFFAALADPTRRAVVEKLTAGPASVSVLAAPHDMALPTFLRHLKVLEKAGVVRSIKKGRVRTCQIDPETLWAAQGWLAWQRAVWENRMDAKNQLAFTLEEDRDDCPDDI